MKRFTLFKSFLLAAGLLAGSRAWATDYSSVLTLNFETEASYTDGWVKSANYDATVSQVAHGDGYALSLVASTKRGSTYTYSFEGVTSFTTATDYRLEFDFAMTGQGANNNAEAGVKVYAGSNVIFAATTPNEAWTTALSITGKEGAITVPSKDNAPSPWFHVVLSGIKGDGIYATVTNTTANETVVNNAKVADFANITSFVALTGRAAGKLYIDDIICQTPKVAGFVAVPEGTITAPAGTSRKFTLSCLTDDVTMYYATSDLEKGAEGWIEYTSETTTDAPTIYVYAKDGEGNTSDKGSFVTGVGTAITLNAPAITKTGYADAVYTVTLSSSQSDLELVPSSVTLYYSIDDGAAIAYTEALKVNGGSTIKVYASSVGFTNSAETTLSLVTRPVFATNWALDFAGQATADKGGVTIGSSEEFKVGSTSFYAITADNFTSNANFGVVDNHNLLLRNTGNKGLYSQASGNRAIGIANLTDGQYVIINCASQASFFVSVSGSAEYVSDFCTSSQVVLKATGDGNVAVTFAKNQYIQSIEVVDVITSVTATIGSTGYTTFSSPYALNLEGVDAYYAESAGASTVTIKSATGTVKAGEGLILKGTAGAPVNIPVAATTGEAIVGNLLVGCPVAKELTADAKYYVLVKNASDEAEFRNLSGTYTGGKVTIPAGKAYLDTTSAGASLRIVFDGEEATSVNTLHVADATEDGVLYNVAGQRVSGSYKGIVIKNGKKFLNK